MNDSTPLPPPLPQSGQSSDHATDSHEATSFHPMQGDVGFASILDALLKRPGVLLYELGGENRGGIIARLIVLILFFAGVYGVVMGSLSGGTQLWAAPVKLSGGIFLSVLLCLPSLYIFLCLNGADVRIGQVSGALLGMVGLTTLLLIGFAPVAWIFSQSTDSVSLMGFLHLIFWVIGLWFGMRMIKGLLICANVFDYGHVRVWVVIFVLVSLQMTSVLRPLIGTADTLLPTEKKFFLQHWLDTLDSGKPSRS